MTCYYNDSEPFVCDWLENLIREGSLPAGEVDRRPVQEVMPDDVRGFTQCHFFAGIGGWAYALQLAGWPDDRPVWTGSCPCQPFSAAGKGKAEDDPRHLWPHWFRLIRECRPVRIFGEQVANGVGLGWLDVVATDLEAEAYTVGAVVLGAHSVGAPHIRQRLWFVADAQHAERRAEQQEHGVTHGRDGLGRRGEPRSVDDTPGARRDGAGQGTEGEARDETRLRGPERGRATGELADATGSGREPRARDAGVRASDPQSRAAPEQPRLQGSPWDSCDWLPCRDGKARPVEPGTFPLAHGVPARVGRLRAYGNAINPYTAAAFVSAYMDIAA